MNDATTATGLRGLLSGLRSNGDRRRPADVFRGLSPRDLLNALDNERRRLVIVHMDAPDYQGIDLGELATRLAAYEQDTDRECIRAQARKRVYIALYQAHLPVLLDCDIIRETEYGLYLKGVNFGQAAGLLADAYRFAGVEMPEVPA